MRRLRWPLAVATAALLVPGLSAHAEEEKTAEPGRELVCLEACRDAEDACYDACAHRTDDRADCFEDCLDAADECVDHCD